MLYLYWSSFLFAGCLQKPPMFWCCTIICSAFFIRVEDLDNFGDLAPLTVSALVERPQVWCQNMSKLYPVITVINIPIFFGLLASQHAIFTPLHLFLHRLTGLSHWKRHTLQVTNGGSTCNFTTVLAKARTMKYEWRMHKTLNCQGLPFSIVFHIKITKKWQKKMRYPLPTKQLLCGVCIHYRETLNLLECFCVTES